jgi:hypothetical protein
MAGCNFVANASPTTGGDDQGGPGGVDSGTPAVAACDVAGDTSLRLCMTFDHQPMVQDLSSDAHPITTASAVAPIAHGAGSAAALITASRVHLAEDIKFDVATMTIDMWIAPTPSPPTQRSWLLDNNTQYFLSYEMDGKVRCGIGSKVVTSGATIKDTAWHHVACTYGADHELHVYIDGDRSGCLAVSTGIPTGGTDGIAIGANYSSSGGGTYTENYVGGIDGLHLYARAMSDAEVCTAAGRSGCGTVACPGGESGEGFGE